MKLSIITINKNNASGLRRTIESVVNQTFPDIEYIIIDGASLDGSLDVIKEYKDKITWWSSEPDFGIYNAMNKGIKKATGDYCQFLNSGDWLIDKNSTKKMMQEKSDYSIIYGNKIKVFSNGKKLYNKEIITDSFMTFYKGTINHASAYIKRTLFEKYGLYDENLKIVSDWKFYLVTIGLNNESVLYKDVDLVYFKMNGISNNNMELLWKERKCVLNQLVPVNILNDYDKYANNINQLNRLNRYLLTRKIVWFIERLLFKLEKWCLIGRKIIK